MEFFLLQPVLLLLLESFLFLFKGSLEFSVVFLLSSFSFGASGCDCFDYFNFVVEVGVGGELCVLVLDVAGGLV